MPLLRTADLECRECPLRNDCLEWIVNLPSYIHSNEPTFPATGIRDDCPLPIGYSKPDLLEVWADADALRRSAETSHE